MKKDLAPWLLLPGIVLTLSSVTLLTLHQSALAATPASAVKLPAAPKSDATRADTYDDGDGDELLEHWGDPKYGREERRQMAGIAGGFLVLGLMAGRRQAQRRSRCEIVPLPTEEDFLKWDSRKAA